MTAVSSAVGKSTSKKKIRVATVFTGVTACAAVFAPAAAHAAEAAPDIKGESCTTFGNPTWLHVGTTRSYACFGFTGDFNTWAHFQEYPELEDWCGGNNYGYFAGAFLSSAGDAFLGGWGSGFAYHQGTTYAEPPKTNLGFPTGGFELSDIHISGWSGTDKCAIGG
jgi:hypothetical protein